MKPAVTAFLSILLLTGCSSSPAKSSLATRQPACASPGTVQVDEIEAIGQVGVYLPPCYDPTASVRYPVLYLLPGFGGDYHEWLATGVAGLTDQQIAAGTIPPLIIVTTDNTYDGLLQASLVRDLVPYIDRQYRSLTERRYRAIAGGSLGGYDAYVLTFQHPDLFSSAGVFGNGLVTGQEAELEAWLKAIPDRLKPRLFLNSGEQDPFMLQQARALIPYLDQYGIQHTEIFTSGGHSNTYWLSNFPAYYQWLAEDWK